MKAVVSILFLVLLVIVAVHRSLAFGGRINKRYYDAWEGNNGGHIGNGDAGKSHHLRHKVSNKDGPCENKPLWFLKSQASLGKLSPYYDCLNNYGVERK